jgi:AbrB family looped-hinge helix DNA binding protein
MVDPRRFHHAAEAPVESVITTRGRFTIPKGVREHLGPRPRGRVKFFVHPDGSVALLPKLPVKAVESTRKPRGNATIGDQTIAAGATGSAAIRRRR